jgi:Ribonuclease toxin, BrnT, of type II toxin-antitoxin system
LLHLSTVTVSTSSNRPRVNIESARTTYGLGIDGKFLVISHTERGDTIRIISARMATTKEKKRNDMKPKKPVAQDDEVRPEYDLDFSAAERGRYAKRLKTEGSNLVLVEPDLARTFPDSASVNAALRSVVEFANLSAELTQRNGGRAGKRRAA